MSKGWMNNVWSVVCIKSQIKNHNGRRMHELILGKLNNHKNHKIFSCLVQPPGALKAPWSSHDCLVGPTCLLVQPTHRMVWLTCHVTFFLSFFKIFLKPSLVSSHFWWVNGDIIDLVHLCYQVIVSGPCQCEASLSIYECLLSWLTCHPTLVVMMTMMFITTIWTLLLLGCQLYQVTNQRVSQKNVS